MFNGRSNDDVPTIWPRHCAAYQNDFFSLTHLHHLKILHCHALITKMTRHSLVFPNTTRRTTVADRADAAMRFRAVRRALSMEVVFLHHAFEPFVLGSA